MSYCVHCGVELADYEKECPLCGTRICDPHRAEQAEAEPMFGDKIRMPEHPINRRFLIVLISLMLLVPFAVVILIDLILSAGLTWPFYVLGAEMCVWVYFVYPFCYKQEKPYLCYIADTLITALYLAMIYYASGAGGWYLPLALPIVLLVGVCGLLCIYVWRRKKGGKVSKTGITGIILACIPGGIDIIITQYLSGSFLPTWSWYATIPILVMSTVLVIISKSVRMSEWIRRRLFI